MKIGLGRMGTAPAVIALVTIALGGVAVAAPVLTNHSAGAVTNSAKSIPATADSTGKKDVKVGLLATIQAKPEHAKDVSNLLTSAQKLAEQEKGTTVWYAFQTGPTTFGIFDAFGTDAARQAHLKGKIAQALLGNAPKLLSKAPDIRPVDLLGAKAALGAASSLSPKGVKLGLLATIQAKPEHAKDVSNLLTSAQKLAEQEKGTTVWYAFQTGPTTFGIFDAFGTDAARQAHLKGKIAQALLGNAPKLLSKAPDIRPVNVLAFKWTDPAGPTKRHTSQEKAGATLTFKKGIRHLTATATCPSGTTLTGGGYVVDKGLRVLVSKHAAKPGNTWTVTTVNTNRGSSPKFHAVAQCQR